MTRILDCTIRDGGYLTNWSFPNEFISDLYKCAVKSGVSYFEIGYINKLKNITNSPFADIKSNFLEKLITSNKQCKIVVMVEADKFDKESFKQPSIIDSVRVATYPNDLKKALNQITVLSELGYEVFLNLMASSHLSEKEFDILSDFGYKNILSSIVISDTFGAFTEDRLEECFNKIKDAGYNKIGFHAHNNQNLALKNTLKAIQLGATVVDATLFGAGRWAGNANVVDVLEYLDLNKSFYIELTNNYKNIFNTDYGFNKYTELSGKFNVHPYYVENMMKDYKFEDIEKYLQKNAVNLPVRYNAESKNLLK